MSAPTLEVRNLTTSLRIGGAWHEAVRDVSFSLEPRRTLALVGESGCGKSLTAMSIMGLLPRPNGRIAGGSIAIDGRELVGLEEKQMEKLRGDRISIIFQEPMTSLNPVLPVGWQIAESLRRHRNMDAAAARAEVIRLMRLVQIPGGRAACRRLSAPIFRWHAPARDDRHGGRLSPRSAAGR